MKTFALQGDTLDAICVRYYGRTEGVVETVLAANPGLAELGAVLLRIFMKGDHSITSIEIG